MKLLMSVREGRLEWDIHGGYEELRAVRRSSFFSQMTTVIRQVLLYAVVRIKLQQLFSVSVWNCLGGLGDTQMSTCFKRVPPKFCACEFSVMLCGAHRLGTWTGAPFCPPLSPDNLRTCARKRGCRGPPHIF